MRNPIRHFLSLVAIVITAALATAHADELLLDRPGFQKCELEAFTALIIARNGMYLGNTRESLLSLKSNDEFSIATINELYDEIAKTAGKDHGGFAARKFYQCAKREGLAVEGNVDGARVCLRRHDIEFYVYSDRLKGRPEEEALGRIKRYLGKEPLVYPPALIDKIVPMVYRATTDDLEFQLRQLIFESCLFPDDWKAWYATVQPRKQ